VRPRERGEFRGRDRSCIKGSVHAHRNLMTVLDAVIHGSRPLREPGRCSADHASCLLSIAHGTLEPKAPRADIASQGVVDTAAIRKLAGENGIDTTNARK